MSALTVGAYAVLVLGGCVALALVALLARMTRPSDHETRGAR